MPCTAKKTFLTARTNKCHVLAQVKGNQENLLQDCMSTASSTRVSDSYSLGPEKGHGRIEIRHGRIYRNLRLLRGSEWEGLVACVGVVERTREVYNTSVRQWEPATEVAYYVCSKPLSAEQLVIISRKHWLIENRCNHVRDTSLHEDANSSRKRPGGHGPHEKQCAQYPAGQRKEENIPRPL
jgi:predicted transposase YbfD/YdcC